MEGILKNAGWRDKKEEEPYDHNHHQLFVTHGRAQRAWVQSEDTVAYLYIYRGIVRNLLCKSILDDNLWYMPLVDQYQDILDHMLCIG
jgi:hypothetical protein